MKIHPIRMEGNVSIRYDTKQPHRVVRRRTRIEIMFGCLKDLRRVATRYDRCPTAFFSRRPRRYRHLLAMINES